MTGPAWRAGLMVFAAGLSTTLPPHLLPPGLGTAMALALMWVAVLVCTLALWRALP